MAETVFERLARSAPVNKQTALGIAHGPEAPDPKPVPTHDATRRIQQAIFNQAAGQYVNELSQAGRQNFYAKDYAKFVRRRIRRGEWSPSIDARSPTKWSKGMNRSKMLRRD